MLCGFGKKDFGILTILTTRNQSVKISYLIGCDKHFELFVGIFSFIVIRMKLFSKLSVSLVDLFLEK